MSGGDRKRMCKIETTCSLRINVGNQETLDVVKHIELDVEFDKGGDLIEKSKKVDAMIGQMVRDGAEAMLAKLNRKRHVKVGDKETEVGLWDDGQGPGPAGTEPTDF